MSQYHFDDRGNPINILSDENLKKLKGKKKLDLIDELRNISERVKNSYTSYLHGKALGRIAF